MQLKVIFIALIILLAGCTAEDFNPENSNAETQIDFLSTCQTNNSTILMNIFQGQSLENANSN